MCATLKRIGFQKYFLCFVLLFSSPGYAQYANTFEEGLALEKAFKTEQAFEKFEAVIKENPNHLKAYTHASRMLSNMGGRLPKSQLEEKRKLLEKARKYAEKSIELSPADPDARLAHIISLGLLSEISRNPREKVLDAKLIHGEAKKIIELDSLYGEAYFVLGKWQLELSRLNWFELMACKLLFGGLPEEISKHAALQYFNKALTINPNSILYLFGQASAYADLGEKEKAIKVLQRALKLPLAEPDDEQRKERCRNLLNELTSR
ncbi:MAG TPA: tetratricopeptide repeat protein [Cyclobacteriaceae bacterium]|nr:tetratricopeptide repeat protein [Cyclobacteriaceae bacterium]HRJ81821.1 tetratricopeptide repeat protein [Cyclobacteriaceae bacterium]